MLLSTKYFLTIPSQQSTKIETHVRLNLMLSVGGVAGLYSLKSHAMHYILYVSPSRDILAEAQLEVKLRDISEGHVAIVKWRGRPVFIYHR